MTEWAKRRHIGRHHINRVCRAAAYNCTESAAIATHELKFEREVISEKEKQEEVGQEKNAKLYEAVGCGKTDEL